MNPGSQSELLLQRLYAAFNARDIETVLAAMHPDVDWPNGWEGGRLQAARQCAAIGRGNGRSLIQASFLGSFGTNLMTARRQRPPKSD